MRSGCEQADRDAAADERPFLLYVAHNMPAIHTPLLILMTYLHARNLRRLRQAPENR